MTETQIDVIGRLTGRSTKSNVFIAAKRHLMTNERQSDLALEFGVSKSSLHNAVARIKVAYQLIDESF